MMHLGIPARESEIAKSAALEGRRTWLIQNLPLFHPPSFIRARTGGYQYSVARVPLHKKCSRRLSAQPCVPHGCLHSLGAVLARRERQGGAHEEGGVEAGHRAPPSQRPCSRTDLRQYAIW